MLISSQQNDPESHVSLPGSRRTLLFVIGPGTRYMQILLLLAAVLGFSAAPSQALTLEGTIEVWEKLGGKPSRLENHSNAVVFVAGFSIQSQKRSPPQLIQKNKSFSSRVLVITQGEVVEFPNLDPIFHNVWSKSKARTFDLGLFKHPETKPVQFPRQGIVTIFCNIHPQMISTILVLPNDRYAMTDSQGNYRIENIPQGKHTVYAWVEGARPIKKTVVFTPGKPVRVNLKLLLRRIPIRHLNKEGKLYKSYSN